MRVIAGSARGRRLFSPSGTDVRPTADRIREALFSSFGDRVAGALFLDLFCGTGAVGVEALSRGAKHAAFVDNSRECAAIVEKNLTHTGFAGVGEIICGDALQAIRGRLRGRAFDITYLDPPYDRGMMLPALRELIDCGVVSGGGLVAAEYGASEDITCPPGYEIYKQKNYRLARIVFYGVI